MEMRIMYRARNLRVGLIRVKVEGMVGGVQVIIVVDLWLRRGVEVPVGTVVREVRGLDRRLAMVPLSRLPLVLAVAVVVVGRELRPI